MLHVVAMLWDANAHSEPFSRCYNEKWVDRLYRGFRRHLIVPFRFVCFTDRAREFEEKDINQDRLLGADPGYGNCIEAFRLNEPMIFVGLDTLIVGRIDHLAAYCLTADRVAMPLHPFEPVACNGVVLSPGGKRGIYDNWRGENDMEWMRKQPHVLLDDVFPGAVRSYKGHVRASGDFGDARIIYFHGVPKPHQLLHLEWVREHWKG